MEIAGRVAPAQEGARLFVVDVNEAGGLETVELIRQAGGDARFFRADVSSVGDTLAMVGEAEWQFGGLDIAQNNAGLLATCSFAGQSIEPYLRMIDVNFIGVALGRHAAILRSSAAGAE